MVPGSKSSATAEVHGHRCATTNARTATQCTPSRECLLEHFRRVREASIEMCRPLDAEMFRIQPSEEVSPPWWNLGHTSWFFARNVLQPFGGEQEPRDADFDEVLNSYYSSLGERLARGRRGLLTRPRTDEIFAYRASVDDRVKKLIVSIDDDRWPQLAFTLMIARSVSEEIARYASLTLRVRCGRRPLTRS